MIRILSFTFILLLSSPTQAGLWSCVCDFIAGKNNPQSLHTCIPNTVIDNASKLERGFRVKLQVKNKEIDGVVLSHNLDEIQLQIGNKTQRIKTTSVKQVHFVEKVKLASKPHLELRQNSLERFNKQLEKIPKSLASLQLQITQEVEYLRTLSSQESRTSFLRQMGEEIEAKIKRKLGSDNLGYHFNLHGGLDYEYAQSGGIFINRGDVFAQHGMNNHTAENIYFFQSKSVGFYELINSYDMRKILNRGRMGDTLIMFDLDNPYFAKALKEKGIIDRTEIYYDFSPGWLRSQPFNDSKAGKMIGIPAETFVTPPLPIYRKSHYRKLGLKNLKREEQNLVYMRLIEDLVLGQ